MQAVFNIRILILGTLIWACLNLITAKVKTAKKCNTLCNPLGLRKKSNKSKAHYCMYCLQYKTVIISLKRTFWFLKSTFYIATGPCLRCIT